MLAEQRRRGIDFRPAVGEGEGRKRHGESALDAVVMMDADGLIIGWNPQAERVFGWTSDEAVGRNQRYEAVAVSSPNPRRVS